MTARITHPDRDMYNLFVVMNQEQRNHDIAGLYEEKSSSMNRSYEVRRRQDSVSMETAIGADSVAWLLGSE